MVGIWEGYVVVCFLYVRPFFGGQMKLFCVFGWGMVGRCGLFRGEMMVFWVVFGVFGLLVGSLRRVGCG